MKLFEFKQFSLIGSFENERMPSLLIDIIRLETNSGDWANKLSNSILKVEFDCLNSEGKIIGNTTQTLCPQVGAYMDQPILVYNHYPVNLDLRGLIIDRSSIAKYRVNLSLSNIDLSIDETYIVGYHLLLHKNYQIYCDGCSIGMVYITENNPLSINKKVVTLVPINRVYVQDHFTDLQLQNHMNFFMDKNLTDDQIIQKLFKENQIVCNGNWTKSEI